MKAFLLRLVVSALLAMGVMAGPAKPAHAYMCPNTGYGTVVAGSTNSPWYLYIRPPGYYCSNRIGPVSSFVRFTCWPGDWYPACIYN